VFVAGYRIGLRRLEATFGFVMRVAPMTRPNVDPRNCLRVGKPNTAEWKSPASGSPCVFCEMASGVVPFVSRGVSAPEGPVP